jgi:hypothetical protein
MNSNGDGKPEPADPENAVHMLELELMRQRATRQHAGAPYRGLRMASLVFFFVVILGAIVAFYYVFVSGGLDEFRARSAAHPTPTVVPQPVSTP